MYCMAEPSGKVAAQTDRQPTVFGIYAYTVVVHSLILRCGVFPHFPFPCLQLLPDLHLTKDVTVTVILAGNEMHSGNRIEEWNLHNITKAICQRSKRLKLAVPTEVTSIGNGSKLRSTRKRQITADEEDDADTSVMGHHAGLATSVKGNPRPEKRHRKLAAVN